MMQYRIHRPISVPIPMFEPNYGASSGGASGMQPTLHTSANSYEVDMTCNITFHLENHILISWEAKGKACYYKPFQYKNFPKQLKYLTTLHQTPCTNNPRLLLQSSKQF